MFNQHCFVIAASLLGGVCLEPYSCSVGRPIYRVSVARFVASGMAFFASLALAFMIRPVICSYMAPEIAPFVFVRSILSLDWC